VLVDCNSVCILSGAAGLYSVSVAVCTSFINPSFINPSFSGEVAAQSIINPSTLRSGNAMVSVKIKKRKRKVG
jgi:hypothetical protein